MDKILKMKTKQNDLLTNDYMERTEIMIFELEQNGMMQYVTQKQKAKTINNSNDKTNRMIDIEYVYK